MLHHLKSAILTSLILLSAGCGYHWGQGGTIYPYRTVSVPYIDGDYDGSFTAALISEISRSGVLTYRNEGGALNLLVVLLEEDEENVGFEYDRKKKRKIQARHHS